MASTRTFQDMLNEYLTYDLLKDDLIKRDYLLTRIEKDNGWKGGSLIVPFKGAGASSVAFGQLTASNDIAEDKYVRGEVSSYKEAWGSMIFNHADLMQHDGAVSEKSFLKILPDAVEDFSDHMKEVLSTNLLNGAHFAKLTVDGTVGAGMTVDRPDRFKIGQKVLVDDDNSAPATGYVMSIDMNNSVVVLESARGSAVVVDLSAYTTAQNAKCYYEGAQASSFASLRDALLSAANGGSASLHGQTKLAYPFLQAINVSGATITATNILSKLFDAFVEVRQKGRGNPNEVLVSFKHLGSILKALESSKGAFNVEPGSMKTSVYGWTEITIGGVKGALKVVGIQELDDDVIMLMDWRSCKFHSNGFFRKRVAPDGKHYFEQRSTTGYQYIVDMCVFGELVVSKPALCGIIHSISY
jgi:hypothetical protein